MTKETGKVVQLAKKSFRRVIGVGELFAIGYGDVGSSIYYTLGATALYALGATPLALLLAGFVFICTAMTYAELSSTFPQPGGSATFSRHAFNDLISFIAGWGLLLDYLLTLAISAFTIPAYLKHAFTLIGIEASLTGAAHTVSVICIILFLCFLNFVGIRSSSRLSLMLAIFTLATQVTVVLMGALLVLNLPYVIDHLRINVANASWSPDWWQFWKGVAMAMVAYTGIESISQLAAETKKPTYSIPRAIQLTIVAVLFLYIGISTIGLSVVSPEELGTRYLEDAVGGIAMNFPVGGRILGPWVGVTAAIILLICANAGLIGCSRLIFAMGANYQVPRFFFSLHKRFRTPHVALFVFSFFAILIILWSRNRMLVLADLYNFGAQIAFFSAHMSLIVLRIRSPKLPRPFRAPFNIPIGKGRSIPLTSILGAFASFSVWCLVVITKPDGRVAGTVWMSMGLIMYFMYRKKKKLPIAEAVQVEEVKIPEYKPMKVKHILVATSVRGGTEALQTALQLAHHHKAKITSACILEIPNALPLNVELKDSEMKGEAALKRAEAIGREYHLNMDLEFIRARSVVHALSELMHKKQYDLLVIGVSAEDLARKGRFASQSEKFLKNTRCRVIFCKS